MGSQAEPLLEFRGLLYQDDQADSNFITLPPPELFQKVNIKIENHKDVHDPKYKINSTLNQKWNEYPPWLGC